MKLFKVWSDGFVCFYHSTHTYRGEDFILVEAENSDEALALAKMKGFCE